MPLPFLTPLDFQETSPSMEIIEKTWKVLRTNLERVGHNALDSMLNPSSPFEMSGRKKPLVTSGDILPPFPNNI